MLKKDDVVLDSKKVFDCQWLRIFKEKIKYPSGQVKDYYTLERDNDYVVILPIKNGKILLEKQWRAPVRDWIWEVPMGARHDWETPEQVVERELLEETGYKAKSVKKLGTYFLAPGYSNQLGNAFWVDDFVKAKKIKKANEEELELIEIKIVSLEKFE